MEWNTRQRHKRSFHEMAQSTRSPSASFTGESYIASSGTLTSVPERRRLSHPHNNNLRESTGSSYSGMAAVDTSRSGRPVQRPRLQHQTSQTVVPVVDLTDDTEAPPIAIEAPRFRIRQRAPSLRPPPQLGRSDAQAMGNVIDLTGEEPEEPEIEVTASRRVQPPPAREGSPSLFMPRNPRRRVAPAQAMDFMSFPRQQSPHIMLGEVARDDGRAHHFLHYIGDGVAGRIRHLIQQHHQVHFPNHLPPMPGQMDYQRQPFEQRKAEHVPPLPAQEGFTRSLSEGDTVICPSCEEELVQCKTKVEEDLPAKKGRKAPTKKEREEHPFWVVKDCGHVYCNKCYQHRMPPSKSATNKPGVFEANFRIVAAPNKKTRDVLCAVDDCQSNIQAKDKWVGVFL